MIYRKSLALVLTVATLTVAVTLAYLTLLAPGRVADLAERALQTGEGQAAVTSALTTPLTSAGLGPDQADVVAAEVLADPRFPDAVERAVVYRDPVPLSNVASEATLETLVTDGAAGPLAALLPTAQGEVPVDVPGFENGNLADLAELENLRDLAGVENLADVPGLESLSDVPGFANFPTAGPSLGGQLRAVDQTASGLTVAGPSMRLPTPMAFVVEHALTIRAAGSALAAAGLGVVLLVWSGRRRRTLTAVGRWALVAGAGPLVIGYAAGPVWNLVSPGAGADLLTVIGPAALAPALGVLIALAAAGAVLLVAPRFLSPVRPAPAEVPA